MKFTLIALTAFAAVALSAPQPGTDEVVQMTEFPDSITFKDEVTAQGCHGRDCKTLPARLMRD